MTAQPAHDVLMAYHEATKHHFHRYARSSGYMDWHNQPNPFRFYDGAAQTLLALSRKDPDISYKDLYTPAPETGKTLTLANLGSFLALSLGLSAWKAIGNSRWSLRINPSSGNLHPTEGHLVVPSMPELEGGVYHYSPFKHTLERRAGLPSKLASRLQSHFGGSGFLVALSTIFWRESWKYGERAYRYCCLDTGHALAALAFSARLHDWQMTCLSGVGDEQIKSVLGFDRTNWRHLEEEHPEVICWVATSRPSMAVPQYLPAEVVASFAGLPFSGTPNPLSRQAVDWPIIAQAAAAAEKPATEPDPWHSDIAPSCLPAPVNSPAAAIIRGRRSAVSYDRSGAIAGEVFWSLLGNTLAASDCAPFGVKLMSPSIQVLLFVHRVTGLDPGLYILVRRADMEASLRSTLRPDFRWQTVRSGWPLYLLEAREVSYEAIELSCHQEIAGYSAFAAAMVAPFDEILRRSPYRYRHLYWECGMIGQALYLGAEAHGIRATGIGCFFDDPVHELLGIKDKAFQSLYHFTVGHPIEDRRLSTLPAYHHLQR